MQPEFQDETPVNVFDLWEGANFKLKIKKVAGYWNYDSSEFDRVGPLLDDDDALEALWNKEYSLKEIVAPDKFKSYEQLSKRLKTVLGQGAARPTMDEEVQEEDDSRGSYTPQFESRRPAPVKEESFNSEDIMPKSSASDEEDETLSYFQRLADS